MRACRVFILAALMLCAASGLYAFQYPDFSSTSGLTLLGSATQFGTVLRLTPASGGLVGNAWYNTAVPVGGGFTTQFEFQISDASSTPADGMAFIIQNDTFPLSLGGAGGGNGYDGLPGTLAVEFDTYDNGGEAIPEISVQTNGILPNSYSEAFSIGSVSVASLADGLIHTVKIVYAPGTMSIYFDDLTAPILVVAVDLSSTLQLVNGAAFVGFGAGTGGLWEAHDILSWSFGGAGQFVAVEPNGKFVLYTSPSYCAGKALVYQKLTSSGGPNGSPKVLTGCDSSVEDIDVYKDKQDGTFWISLGTASGKFLMRITKGGGILLAPVNVLTPAQAGGIIGPAAMGGPGATIYMWVLINGVIERIGIDKGSLAITAWTSTGLAASGGAVQASQNVSNRLLAFDANSILTGSMLTKNGLPTGTLRTLLLESEGFHVAGGVAADGQMSLSISSFDRLLVQKVGYDGFPRGGSMLVTSGGGLMAGDVSNPINGLRWVVYQNNSGVYLQKVTSTGDPTGSATYLGF